MSNHDSLLAGEKTDSLVPIHPIHSQFAAASHAADGKTEPLLGRERAFRPCRFQQGSKLIYGTLVISIKIVTETHNVHVFFQRYPGIIEKLYEVTIKRYASLYLYDLDWYYPDIIPFIGPFPRTYLAAATDGVIVIGDESEGGETQMFGVSAGGAGSGGRGLHSSTLQLNVSFFVGHVRNTLYVSRYLVVTNWTTKRLTDQSGLG
jgi:hypothetical protein